MNDEHDEDLTPVPVPGTVVMRHDQADFDRAEIQSHGRRLTALETRLGAVEVKLAAVARMVLGYAEKVKAWLEGK